MNWNFSAWAIRNPVPPILLFVCLIALGLYSFSRLPITMMPNIDLPLISVTITDGGSAPSELETQVTKPVEDAVAGISGVRHIYSTVTDGVSSTVVEFNLDVATDRALNDVKDAVAEIRGDLPGTIDEPVARRIDIEGQAIITYAAASPAMTPEELSWFVDDKVIRDLQTVSGVGRVERMGGVKREIQVQIDPDRLMALGITASQVNTALRSVNADLSGGKGEVGGQTQAVRTLASAHTLADLAATRLPLSDGRNIRLSDVGQVVDHWAEPKSFARLDGRPAVAFAIYRAKGASDASVSEGVGKVVDRLAKDYPGVSMKRIDDSTVQTYNSFENSMKTLIEGALLAVIVVLLFLRDFRATIISAIALPLSAIPTFFALDMLGFSLNMVSLLGITLVTGILVDDAIVEIENIVRHIRTGKKPYRAAVEAADEIGLAVIAISTTIIAIFSPVSFMSGISGQYFRQFGLTVALAVFFSLLTARLITPMLAAYFMKTPYTGDGEDGRPVYRGFVRTALRRIVWFVPLGVLAYFGVYWLKDIGPLGERSGIFDGVDATVNFLTGSGGEMTALWMAVGVVFFALFTAWLTRPHPEEHEGGPFVRAYAAFLKVTLWSPKVRVRGHVLSVPVMPVVTIVACLSTFLFAMEQAGKLPTELFAPGDQARIVTSIELPPGSTLDDTRGVTDTISDRLHAFKEVKSVFVMGGTSPTGTLETRRAALIVNLVPRTERTQTQKQMEYKVQAVLRSIPDIRFFFVNERGDREATVGVLGKDGEAVAKAAASLENDMRGNPMFSNPSALSSFARPEIRVTPRRDVASDLGVSTDALSQTLRVATVGDVDANLAKFNDGDRQIPVRVQLDTDARGNIETLAALRIPTASGVAVPLSAVADIGFGQGPSTIDRYDRARLVKVGTDMMPGFTSGQGLEAINALPAVKAFPAGVTIQNTGDAEIQAEIFEAFAVAMIAGLTIVFIVLILLFNSVFQPITILGSIPLSIGGVVVALLITGYAVSMPVIIGILMLMGIVTKNAIMLVDFAVERQKHGLSETEAIIDAGRKRARPIVMTTIAMVAGMYPAAHGGGQGAEFMAPMAIAVIGGLLVSTVLSLVFIPSFYLMINRLNRAIGWVFGKLADPNESDEAEIEADAHPPATHPQAPARPHLVSTAPVGPRPTLLGPDGIPLAAE
ncbi:Multidrug resistance protein MdtC [Pleomorphomonas sp. T1.2MG-36]|uniref:efflux RND transporter permease subunit n=1 Tax=Pleomorphomonas sp. T1.2MG-36 TaxID=3041167 RepID=UPI002477A9DB|nr:efflux RND transporter permease subunit [Pleomorphomonas sp. T1.2MG-36]CAI9417720.1 Multidrug resistance protein MdtC [Pleomorphomonas sp. T1.2MG-36]